MTKAMVTFLSFAILSALIFFSQMQFHLLTRFRYIFEWIETDQKSCIFVIMFTGLIKIMWLGYEKILKLDLSSLANIEEIALMKTAGVSREPWWK